MHPGIWHAHLQRGQKRILHNSDFANNYTFDKQAQYACQPGNWQQLQRCVHTARAACADASASGTHYELHASNC
jgi:hypothetical protein